MEKLKKILISPSRIYGWTFAAFLVILFIGIPALNFGNNGRLPFAHVLFAFAGYTVLLFLLSIFTSIIYWQWFKKYWYINVVIALTSGYFIFIFLVGASINFNLSGLD